MLPREAGALNLMALGGLERTEGEDKREQMRGRGSGSDVPSDPGICINAGFLSK